MSDNKGFTFIEWLVLISLILFLIALAAPLYLEITGKTSYYQEG